MKTPAHTLWLHQARRFEHHDFPENRQSGRWLIRTLDTHPSSKVRRTCAYLAAWNCKHPHIHGALIRRIRDCQEHPLIRAQALEALTMHTGWYRAQTRRDRKAHRAILQCLHDPHPLVRFWACYAAGHLRLRRASTNSANS